MCIAMPTKDGEKLHSWLLPRALVFLFANRTIVSIVLSSKFFSCDIKDGRFLVIHAIPQSIHNRDIATSRRRGRHKDRVLRVSRNTKVENYFDTLSIFRKEKRLSFLEPHIRCGIRNLFVRKISPRKVVVLFPTSNETYSPFAKS